MSLTKDQISSKIRGLCHTLMDAGVSAQDYLEQITYLIFLKMAHEKTLPPYNNEDKIPAGYNRAELLPLDGDDLELHYRHTLEKLSKEEGILGLIFRRSQNKISNPALLKRVISEIDKIDWNILGVDVKGEIYESLLRKVAEDTKSGAGQYFTPRVLIKAMVDVMQPSPKETVNDPCCGTGGFLLSAHDYILQHHQLDRDQQKRLKTDLLSGNELVPNTARLCVMNMFLNGIGENKSPITIGDSLIRDPGKRYNIVLTNPPFGKKSSLEFTTKSGAKSKTTDEISREDFWTTTKNKQINFVQHIHTILEQHGKAAVVLPDNVLFEGGAGEIIRTKLLEQCNLHTILRLPTGIFYANGVKANVLFFDKKPASDTPRTKEIRYYDLRTNMHFSLKTQPLKDSNLEEFVSLYNPANIHDRKETRSEENPGGRRRKYLYEDVVKRDKTNLDIFWVKDKTLEESENLPDPDVLAKEIVENLEVALQSFSEVEKELEN